MKISKRISGSSKFVTLFIIEKPVPVKPEEASKKELIKLIS